MNIGVCLAVTDSITITEKAGVSTTNYPVQLGRPFLQGEIPSYPQAVISGAAVLTQADVKQRYSDGSVKHAILSFLIPSLAANSTITVTFQNQASGNNTPLTTAQMVDSAYNFDAQMELSAPSCPGCTVQTASARTMLSSGAYTYWTSGPVATTAIIADHTTKAYDVGWQNDKVTTTAAKIGAGDTTIQVANASGWTAPMLIRVNGNTTDTSSNLAAEDISICAVNTSATPNTLTVGTPGSCPSAAGRGSTSSYWGSGMSVYPNLWKAAPSSSYKSFRPIFHATFWPGINKVRVRFVGEVADTEKLQDQIYSLALKLGYSGPSTVYTNPQVIHRAATRWTKEFWIGGQPPAIQIDHNFPYLVATRFLYNFDTTKSFSFAAIQTKYNAWIASNRDLYQGATIETTMGSGGNSDHTGFYTGWDVWWLYTMDNRAKQMATESADLGAAWLFHYREGNAAKSLTRSPLNGCTYLCSQPGLGHVLSLTSRPSITTRSLKRTDRAPGDPPVFVGSSSNGIWTLGMNHTWEPYTPIYTVTGDFWYLEESWFWASFGAGYTLGPVGVAAEYMRGPTGAEGTIVSEQCKYDSIAKRWYSYPYWEEIRTQAWIFRARANSAFVSPDNAPEKSYFETLTRDAIAGMEGWHNVPASGTDLSYLATWTWANTVQNNQCGLSPLNLFGRGGEAFVQTSSPYYGMDNTKVAEANGYGVYYMMFALGRAAELGFPATAIGQWAGKYYVDLITQCSNPYLIQMGRYPATKIGTYDWFSNWTDFRNAYTSDYANRMSFSNDGYLYVFAGMAAVAMAHQVTQSATSQQAWNFMKANVLDAFTWTSPDVIKWAVIPRGSALTTPPPGCDLNGDGLTNVLDVQLAIQSALGVRACGTADLNGDGKCDVLDVQQEIKSALSGTCVTGP
jgi:hypothetical protein